MEAVGVAVNSLGVDNVNFANFSDKSDCAFGSGS